jgi:hypothetical protein
VTAGSLCRWELISSSKQAKKMALKIDEEVFGTRIVKLFTSFKVGPCRGQYY